MAHLRTYTVVMLGTLIALGAVGCSQQNEEEVSVAAAAITVAPPVSSFVILARRSVSLADRTVITGGNIGVSPGTGATLNTLTCGSDTKVALGAELLAQRIVMRDRATTGNVNTTRLEGSTAGAGARSPYVAPPTAPSPTAATAGTTPVAVSTGQTLALAPGRYGAVTVNGILELTGGLYEFQSLLLNNDAKVVATGSSVLRLTTGLKALDRVRVITTSGQASDLTVEAMGTVDAANHGLLFGNDGALTALVAAQAAFGAGDRFIATGAISAQDVILGHDGVLTYGGGGFQCNTASSCEDGNACTENACTDMRCSAAPVISEACAPSILVATSEEPRLGSGPLSTFSTSEILIGRIVVPVGLTSASIAVNGGPATALTLDSGGNFSLPLTLLGDTSQVGKNNILVFTVIDAFGAVTTKTVNIELLSAAVPDELVLLFNPDTTAAERTQQLNAVNGTLKRQLTEHVWLATVPPGTVGQAINTINAPTAKIRSVFPNAVLKPAFVPNDSSRQTEYLQAIRAFDAWDTEIGSKEVIVAVADSGIRIPSLVSTNNCPGVPITRENNLYLNDLECCGTKPCSASQSKDCMPGSKDNPNTGDPFSTFGDCPRIDQNADGCPGVCGLDDDHDGAADMADPDIKRLYSNGFDDDGDGQVDEQAIVGGVTKACSAVSAGELIGAPTNGDCDGAANDDDENGYPDDCRGWNFGRIILPECTPAQEHDMGNGTCLINVTLTHPNQTLDTRGFHGESMGHGEYVAEILGSPGNDCSGGTGVALKVSIMPLEVQRYFPPTATEPGSVKPDLAAAIEAYQYAAAMGAHVVNSSFSMGSDDAFVAAFPQLNNSHGLQLITDLMDLSNSGSVLHVMAAGNSKSDISGWVQFPAQAKITNKIVVAGSDPANDGVWTGSNYSATTVDLAAPAERLLWGFSGTSGAAPLVSGAAALLMSHYPELRGQPSVVAQMLRASARPSSAWAGKSKTGGVLDIAASFLQPISTLLFRDNSLSALPGDKNLPTTELELIDSDFDGRIDYMFEAQCSRTNGVGQPHLRVLQSGVLTDRTSEMLPVFEGSFCDVVDGDVNGDGRADVVLAGFLPDGTPSQQQNRVLLGGASGFTSGTLPVDTDLTRAASLCDVDSDGDLDIYFANVGTSAGPANSVLLMNDGSGNFTDVSSTALPNPMRGQSPHNVLCLEVDAAPANLCQGLGADICSLCANPELSVGGLIAAGRVASADGAACLSVRALVKPELVIANSEGSNTTLLRRNAAGTFEDHTCDLNLPHADGSPSTCVPGVVTPGRQDQDVAAADFNGDGAVDLAFISRRGNPNTLLFNNGSGVFTNVTASNWSLDLDDARGIEVADVDSDGDRDILVVRGDPNLMNPGENTLYLNDGSGKFTVYVASGLGSKVDMTTAARFADLDYDGDADIVTARYGKNDRVFINTTIP